jgi:hypothetical protein
MSPPSSGLKIKPRLHAPPKRRWTINRLHGVITQKVELFITTAVRTSKLNLLHLIKLIRTFLQYILMNMFDIASVWPILRATLSKDLD